MERTKYRLMIILLGLFAMSLQGNNRSEIYDCYINNRMSVWKDIINRLDSQPEKSQELLLELTNYQYGYIGWCLGNKRKDEALVYLKKAEENVKILESMKFERALLYGYKSAFFGFRIALSKLSAPFNGHKSAECAKDAILLDANQPFGYVQLGNVQFHMPPLMGGSKTEAIGYYLKAKNLMERKKEEIRGDWNYLSLMATIARGYESINDHTKAKLMYEEILKFEPGFMWVRDELYPQLLKKTGTIR